MSYLAFNGQNITFNGVYITYLHLAPTGRTLSAGIPNLIIAREAISFSAAGFNRLNTARIYKIDNPIEQFIPGYLKNKIDSSETDEKYVVIPLMDFSLPAYFE